MRYILIVLFLSLLAMPSASALNITNSTQIQPNVSTTGYYIIRNLVEVTIDELVVNSTYATFFGLTGNQRGAFNTDTDALLCASGTVNCTLPQTNAVINVTFGFPPDINLSFGPPNTTIFRYLGCGPDKVNASSEPANQTATYGIDLICNNGTLTTDVQIMTNGSLNPNWTLYASNTSILTNLITLANDTWQTIYTNLVANACTYIWHLANCSYVNQNPGVFIDYRTN